MSATLPELSYKMDAMQHSVKKKPVFSGLRQHGVYFPNQNLACQASVRCPTFSLSCCGMSLT